jgi:Cu-processing system permease protein
MSVIAIGRLELLIARRNMWVATAVVLMSLFTVVLTLAGGAPTGTLGVDALTVAASSITTLSVYLVPLIALLLSFDAIAGESERGTLALSLTYPVSRGEILLGKFLAHFSVLAFAIATGLILAAALTVASYGGVDLSYMPLIRLFFTALALGAAFLGIGYTVSALVRQPAAASGIVILIWLVCVVLYDIALLGALVGDDGGAFTKTVFPWLLIANPADAFRLFNLPEASVAALTSGISAAGNVSGSTGQLASLLLWPVLALSAAGLAFRKIEP